MTEAAAVQKGNNCQVVEVVEVVDVVKVVEVVKVVYATANHIQYITKDNRGLIKKISITQPPYKYECINKHNLNDHNDIDLSDNF